MQFEGEILQLELISLHFCAVVCVISYVACLSAELDNFIHYTH